MEMHHCWRCKKAVPFFDEVEWALIEKSLSLQDELIKDYRKRTGCDLETALEKAPDVACHLHEQYTGHAIENYAAIWKHRRSDWGAECPTCGYLFRRPRARVCAHCGYSPVKDHDHT